MKIELEIDEKTLTELVTERIAGKLAGEYSCREQRNAKMGIRDACDKAVQKYIYSQKDKIIENVIDRATKELVRKGLPQLLEREV